MIENSTNKKKVHLKSYGKDELTSKERELVDLFYDIFSNSAQPTNPFSLSARSFRQVNLATAWDSSQILTRSILILNMPVLYFFYLSNYLS